MELKRFLKLAPIFFLAIIPLRSWSQDCPALLSTIDSYDQIEICDLGAASPAIVEWGIVFRNIPNTNTTYQILFDWGDGTPPQLIDANFVGPGTVPGTVNYEVTVADGARHEYTGGMDCSLEASATLVLDGISCGDGFTITNPVIIWNTDDMNAGMLAVNPMDYEVCFNNPVIDAVFQDASTFNCNPTVEPDRPNTIERHVQFVYGTNHPANSIRDLTLNGGAITLTDNTGALNMTETRGGVTGAFFGPIDNIPDPAVAPLPSITGDLDAPANPANIVGSRFEITMFNWNVCNPWNGDVLNPNYADAIQTPAYITIVDAPNPTFITRRNGFGGAATKNFCIGETVYFDNNTTGGADEYEWTFFDGELLTDPVLGNSTANNPTFVYDSGGIKIVRLLVRDTDPQSSCEEIFIDTVKITPTAIAQISLTNLVGNPLTDPFYCQDISNGQTFDIRFIDSTDPGGIDANTEFRWEFYDESGMLTESFPAGAGNFSGAQISPIDRTFVDPGVYNSVLIIRDALTNCPTRDTSRVIIYQDPIADLESNIVCEGDVTTITNLSTVVNVNGAAIDSIVIDLDYDGITFNDDTVFTGNISAFDYDFGSSDTTIIALEVYSDSGSCSSFTTDTVVVLPVPISDFLPGNVEDCPDFTVVFENIVTGQSVTIDRYEWYIDSDDGMGFVLDSVQNETDQFYERVFVNSMPPGINHDYRVFLRAISVDGCIVDSDTSMVRVFPGPQALFDSDYDLANANCAPQEVNFDFIESSLPFTPDSIVWNITQGTTTILNDSVQDNLASPFYGNLAYTFLNTSATVQQFRIEMQPYRDGSCILPDEEIINIFPRPSSVFLPVDTVLQCDSVSFVLRADVDQLNSYEWIFSEPPLNAFAQARETTVSFLRGPTNRVIDIRLVTTNAFNCPSDTTTFFQLIEAEEPDLIPELTLLSVKSDCPPFEATFQNTSTNVPSGTVFRFFVRSGGSGFVEDTATSGSLDNIFTYEFPMPGQYLAILEATTPFNCVVPSSPPDTVVVFESTLAQFDIFDESGCAPLELGFSENSINAMTTSWTIEDTTSGNLLLDNVDTTFAFFRFENQTNQHKSFRITLETVSNNNCISDSTRFVTVYPRAEAEFIASELATCEPYDVNFFNLSDNPDSTLYNWQWGDGTLEFNDSDTVSHTFNNPTANNNFQFNIVLDATTPDGCNASFNQSITTFPRVEARIGADVTIGCAPFNVNFTNNSTGNSSPNNGWYILETGELIPSLVSNNQTTSILFENKTDTTKVFFLFYLAENLGGCIDSDTLEITVYPELDAHFITTGPTEGCSGINSSFQVTNFNPGLLYTWNWGDGSPQDTLNTQPVINHSFENLSTSNSEVFQVTLNVEDTVTGCKDTFMDLVTVFPNVEATISSNLDRGCAPLSVVFSNESQGITNHKWTYRLQGTTETIEETESIQAQYSFENSTTENLVYEVLYEGTNSFGCIDYDTLEILVFPAVSSSFTLLTDREGCGPLNSSFIVDQFVPGLEYVWNWSDGSLPDTTFKTPDISHLFENGSASTTRSFTITLSVRDTISGCVATSGQTVNVFPSVQAEIISDIREGCAPLSVSFENQSVGAIDHEWSIINGRSESVDFDTSTFSINYEFRNQSTTDLVYQVIYTGANGFGCVDRDTVLITTYPQIDASFSATPERQVLPNRTVVLDNTSLNRLSWSHNWDFGDGNNSDQVDPGFHEYVTFGEYTIALTVASDNCTDQATQNIIIEPNVPLVDFSTDTLLGCVPFEVQFENLTQFADPNTYQWNFGDGSTSRAVDPLHVYDRPGFYTVSLKASNDLGISDIEVKEFYIEVLNVPNADFEVKPDVVYLPNDILFTSNRSRDADSFWWDFGDGTTSQNREPTHIYQEPGSYLIKLVAINNLGCTDTSSVDQPILVTRSGRILVPNAFSPNLGGPTGGRLSDRDNNNVFLPITEGVVEFNMVVFNKWGELLFESNSRDIGWDGYVNGRLSPPDVYVYRIEMMFANGQRSVRVGDFTLIR
jgi:gliding motility-associated-like protein